MKSPKWFSLYCVRACSGKIAIVWLWGPTFSWAGDPSSMRDLVDAATWIQHRAGQSFLVGLCIFLIFLCSLIGIQTQFLSPYVSVYVRVFSLSVQMDFDFLAFVFCMFAASRFFPRVWAPCYPISLTSKCLHVSLCNHDSFKLPCFCSRAE